MSRVLEIMEASRADLARFTHWPNEEQPRRSVSDVTLDAELNNWKYCLTVLRHAIVHALVTILLGECFGKPYMVVLYKVKDT